jgi:hypothetical protein
VEISTVLTMLTRLLSVSDRPSPCSLSGDLEREASIVVECASWCHPGVSSMVLLWSSDAVPSSVRYTRALLDSASPSILSHCVFPLRVIVHREEGTSLFLLNPLRVLVRGILRSSVLPDEPFLLHELP